MSHACIKSEMCAEMIENVIKEKEKRKASSGAMFSDFPFSFFFSFSFSKVRIRFPSCWKRRGDANK